MDKAKEIALCVVPYMVSAMMMFPFAAIVGGGLDPFVWDRADRVMYFVFSGAFGTALLARLLHGDK